MNRSGYKMRRDGEGRRRKVVTMNGIEGYWAHATGNCSGCTEWSEGQIISGPSGCDECGYTGRRVWEWFVPFDDAGREAMLRWGEERGR